MSKGLIGVLGVLGVGIAVLLIAVVMYFSYSNKEVRLRNQITAKQKDNTSQLDNTIKTISQTAQVTDAQTQAFKDIIVGNSQARSTKGGSLATLVHEAVPNLDVSSKTFQNLQNIIVSARSTWTNNQRELLDYKREHDNLLDMFPGSLFLSGRQKIDVVIVTSSRTEESFRTGKDDDTDVFGHRKPAPAPGKQSPER